MIDVQTEADARIARAALCVALKELDKLKGAPTPLPFGLAQRFKSFVPGGDMQSVAQSENPYWAGYGATMLEFIEVLDRTPKQQFVEKRVAKP